MKAYYYENNGYNGILLTSNNKWISYPDRIDGVEITRENIPQIVENLRKYGYSDDDFIYSYEQQIGTLIYGEDVESAIKEQNYVREIYID